MAEKNTESTAVNQLIELVATAKPLPPDPDEDLMFKPVGNTRTVSAPRMTTTIPPVAGAGEVAPLPRARALGTQQGLQTIKAVPPGVRMSTQQRAITIPPLTAGAAKSDYDDDAEVTNPGPSTLARPTTQGFSTAAPPPTPTLPAAYSRPTTPAPIAARATGSHATQRPSAPPPPPPARQANDSIASRVTKPTLPPPLPTMRASSPPPPPAARVTTPAFAVPVVEAPMTLDEPAFRPSLQQTSDFAYPLAHPSMMPATLPSDDDDALASILEPKVEASEAGASWLEKDIGTQPVPKQSWQAIAGKLVAPMVILVIAGIFIGGYFAFDGDGGKKRAPKASEGQKITMAVTPPAAEPAKTEPAKTEAPVAEPAKTEPAAEPAKTEPAKTEPAKTDAPVTPPNLAAATEPAKTEPAKTEPSKPEPGARPTLVDIRIDSNPTGATVMLIDRGKQTFLGTTPMSAAVDISRKYELVFSYEGRATVVEALDPQVQKKMSVRLSRTKSSSTVATPAVVAPKPAVDKPAVDKPVAVATKPAVEKPHVDKAEHPADKAVEKPHVDKPAVEKPKAAAQAGGEGILMISSKPPCEIHVDGKPTGLTTPQRSITLPAGAHKITLVNATEGIKKTLSVQITADKPTKVIQDFMK